jgi:Ca2+-binding EF-hand superfamily protein
MIKNDRNVVTGGYRPPFTVIRTLCLFFVSAVFLFPANCVLARENPIDALFNAVDTDGDGLISEQEWQKAMQKRFEALDNSDDGNISRDEFERQTEIMRERFLNRDR